MKRFKMIIIDGRRWFQKTYGNTYHSVSVTIDGAPALVSGQHYGYDDQYLQTAFEMLQRAGYFKELSYSEWCSYRYDEKNRKKFYITVHDVSRERDL